MNPSEARVVFMGSPEFAVPTLDALVQARYRIVLAVTQPDRPAGRGAGLRPPAVKVAAARYGIPVFQPDSIRDEAAIARLAAASADVFVVAAYGKILPRRVIALPARGILNVHASLLPRWRGPSPVAAAILAGDAETGVTIMEIAPKMDAGPIVAQRATPIEPAETAGELEARLARLGASLLIEALPGWYDRSIVPTPQDDALATYCPLLRKEDGHLRRDMSAVEAERAVRAYNPWPGAFVLYGGQRLAIWRSHVISGAPGPAGSTAVLDRRPAVAFSGGWLVLDEVQRPGARRVPGEAFLNGLRRQLEPAVGLA